MVGLLFPDFMKSFTSSEHDRIRVNPFVTHTTQTRGPQKSATIHDVARAARVSTATVSRALSNPDLLSDRTRAAVMDAIRSTGYRVNQAARNLRMQRAGAVLILVPNLGKPFYSRILAGISDGFADSDYAVLIADTESRPLREGELLDYFLDGRIDGVISLDGGIDPRALEACVDAGLGGRIVFLCEWVEGAAFPVIRADNAEGARLAIRHLHALGHTRIAHVTGPEGNVLTIARRRGMLEERARLGLPARAEWIIRGDFSLESGHRAAEQILTMVDRPTAVFCAADMVAFGLIAGLQAGGLSVPGDISVIGFDDIDMSEYYVPSLTTVRQDRHRLGRAAAEALLQRLGPGASGQGAPDVMVELDLVVRDSSAPPP
jgi:LacI family repressor for deo operon, udp, cdd, tsx, nupC, and nupG